MGSARALGLKASFFWADQDRQNGQPHSTPFAGPRLVDPLWDVCIDDGKVGTAVVVRRGHQVCRYPRNLGVLDVVTLVWSRDELGESVAAMNEAFEWLYASLEKEKR